MLHTYFKIKLLTIRAAMEYISNFWIMVISGVIVPILFFVMTGMIYTNLPSVGGWSRWELLLMAGFMYTSKGLMDLLFDGVWNTTEFIYNGKFDVVLSRPMSPLFQIVCQGIGLQGFGQFTTGLVILVMAMVQLQLMSIGHFIFTFLFLCCGTVFRLSTVIIFISSSFKMKSNVTMIPFVAYDIGEYARYPLAIYPMFVRIILFTIIPFGFIGYLPVLIFRGEHIILFSIFIVISSLLYFTLAQAVFHRGIQSYESMGM